MKCISFHINHLVIQQLNDVLVVLVSKCRSGDKDICVFVGQGHTAGGEQKLVTMHSNQV